jgi:hypothetical protein
MLEEEVQWVFERGAPRYEFVSGPDYKSKEDGIACISRIGQETHEDHRPDRILEGYHRVRSEGKAKVVNHSLR